MRKTIAFEKPIMIDQNGTKLTIESIAGEVQYRNGHTRFRPDIRGLEGYIDLEIPEQEEQVITQAMEQVTVRKRVKTVVKDETEIIEDIKK